MTSGELIAMSVGGTGCLFAALTFAFNLTDRIRNRGVIDAREDQDIRRTMADLKGSLDRVSRLEGLTSAAAVMDARLGEQLSRLQEKAERSEELRERFIAFEAQNKSDHTHVREAINDLRQDQKSQTLEIKRAIEQCQAQIRNIALGQADQTREIRAVS